MAKLFLGLTSEELDRVSQRALETAVAGVRDGFIDSIAQHFQPDAKGLVAAKADIALDQLMKGQLELARKLTVAMIQENNNYLSRQLVALGVVSEEQLPDTGYGAEARIQRMQRTT